jgi:acyl-CoA synthetase (AMP-forming)/AMP-acid ligase II
MAVCVPKVTTPGCADALFAFIEGSPDDFSGTAIFDFCKRTLPLYMVPESVFFIDKMPLNANGKINRKELVLNEEYRKNHTGC